MTTLAAPPRITPRPRLWTVAEYHRMAYPAVFGPEENLELVEGEIFFRGTDTRRPFTLADYRRLRKMGLLQTGDWIDLIDGKGVPAMSPMGRPHAVALVKAEDALRAAFGVGFVFWTQSPAELSDVSEPEPDVLIAPGRADEYLDHPPAASDALLVVEISDSSLRQDRDRKARMYAQSGATDYWIVNLPSRTLEVRRQPVNGEYTSLDVYGEREAAAPLAAPHAPVRVADLLPLARPDHPAEA